jgi:hypothetical protein
MCLLYAPGHELTIAASIAAALVIAMSGTAGIAQAEPGPTDGPTTIISSDGTYAVGSAIAPGTYSSAGPIGDSPCYWKRLKGDIVVDDALSTKPQVVQIGSDDTAFKTDNCQPWQMVDCAATCPLADETPHDAVGELRSFLASHQ